MSSPSESYAVSKTNEKSSIISKSVQILDVLAASPEAVRFSDVIRKADLTKSSGHRILSVLTNEGLVAYDEDSRTYRLGNRIMGWALRLWNSLDLQQIADEDMRWLNRQTEQHSVLAVLDRAEIIFIKMVESRAPLRMASNVGSRAPVHCTALGKAMVAFLPEDKRRRLVGQIEFTRHTDNTITSSEDFEIELERVRKQGFALADQEETNEVRGLAAPIFDYQGNIVAAVNVWAHVYRIDRDTILGWAPLVIEAAARISSRLGYFGQ